MKSSEVNHVQAKTSYRTSHSLIARGSGAWKSDLDLENINKEKIRKERYTDEAEKASR